MCGRYGRIGDKQSIAEHYRISVPDFPIAIDYNIAPRTMQPVIRLNPETGEMECVVMNWGMRPYWVKPADVQKAHHPINARSDNLNSGTWRIPFQRYHCLIPVSFMIEWPEVALMDPGQLKIPQVYRPKDHELFSFLGIYDRWKDPTTGEYFESFAFITVEANEIMSKLPHSRIPAMARPRDYMRWLKIDPDRPATDLFRALDSADLETYQINPDVGRTTSRPGQPAVIHGPEVLRHPTEEQVAELIAAAQPKQRKTKATPKPIEPAGPSLFD